MCQQRGSRLSCPGIWCLRRVWQSGDPYEAVCDGCQTACDVCVFDEPLRAPICTEVLDHSTSSGGKVTLETLSIESGYWRATTSSDEILACYHDEACRGGVTGVSDYCLEGYEGPCKKYRVWLMIVVDLIDKWAV